MSGDIFCIDRGEACPDREGAAAWHRVARVEGKVVQDLLYLCRITSQRRNGGIELRRYLDVLAEDAGQDRDGLGDQGVEIQCLQLERLSPAESKELVRQRRST